MVKIIINFILLQKERGKFQGEWETWIRKKSIYTHKIYIYALYILYIHARIFSGLTHQNKTKPSNWKAHWIWSKFSFSVLISLFRHQLC